MLIQSASLPQVHAELKGAPDVADAYINLQYIHSRFMQHEKYSGNVFCLTCFQFSLQTLMTLYCASGFAFKQTLLGHKL